jgi:hypothetical protein
MADDWHPVAHYDHCLVKRVESKCKLQFSMQILAAVMICNCAKVVLMIWALWKLRNETFVTFGDAIAKPDDTTKSDCLMGRNDAGHDFLRWRLSDSNGSQPIVRHGKGTRRWGAAPNIRRWSATVALCSAAIASAACLLPEAANSYNSMGTALLNGNFGAVDPNLLVTTVLPKSGTSALLLAVLVVNSPQVILSFCYLLLNGLFTCMHLAHEYSGYAKQRKPLRVTTAKGEQRSTYWLQLPYTYGVPLMVASAVLHWLISQSIFLARIEDVIDEEGYGTYLSSDDLSSNRSDIGISIAPILASVILASSILLTVASMGFRKLESNMPVAASCSFALAAATHRPKEDIDASVLPVMWGELPETRNENIGHCCFTSQGVLSLVPGRKYARA